MLRQTTRDLRMTEKKYALLMEAANEAFFALNKDLDIISANDKAKRLF